MRKLSFILFGLLIVSANYAFAEDHAKVAIEHAKEAASASKPSDAVHHAGAALDHALAGSISEKGVTKAHLSAGAEELEKAIDQGNLGQLDLAVAHSNAALEHLNAAAEEKAKNKK
jgi:hypothetical protein